MKLGNLVSKHEEKSFINWMRTNNEMYVSDQYYFRLGIFLQNKRFVESFNKNGATFRLALNRLACLTHDEYKSMLGYKKIRKDTTVAKPLVGDAPNALDWRDKNIVNPIQDQGQCGSCWAFSTVQTIESTYALKKQILYKFSEQNLVDCDITDYGCDGGDMPIALDFIIHSQNGMLNLLSDYPYTASEGNCQFSEDKGVKCVSSWIGVYVGNEDDMAEKIYKYGPAAIAIDASSNSFMLYSGGIYENDSCDKFDLDHAVGCVGWGEESGVKYWLVRNSWGVDWGEAGYVRMLRGTNMCGVATEAVVAIP